MNAPATQVAWESTAAVVTRLLDEDEGSIVYVPQDQTRYDDVLGAPVSIMDFTPALRYGRIVMCLPPNISIMYTQPVIASLRESMRRFRPKDYLVAIGSPIVIAISAKIAMEKTGGRLNLLTWDRRERQYLLSTISM